MAKFLQIFFTYLGILLWGWFVQDNFVCYMSSNIIFSVLYNRTAPLSPWWCDNEDDHGIGGDYGEADDGES